MLERREVRRIFSAVAGLVLAGALAIPAQARAGLWEFSIGFSFNRSDYGESGYSMTRRYGGSIGYYLNPYSQVELSYNDSTTRTLFVNSQDITTHDQVYSANYVQHFMSRRQAFQPYLKLGIGQLIREAEGTYWDGSTPARSVSSVTGVISAGMKVKLTQTFSLRGEVTSYLEKARIETYQDNVSLSIGGSLYF